ncbi:RDD family protein [Candidatus Neomicrothrix sp.]|uniref:RDD family protein n=1 Tax=Candidatus Neomicrothrix sp. TaxID=2719034 RepID=UPI002593D28D|nr:RDD family protein [Candidatus Microthrix sp.]HMS49715.1 RDD family protein [Candidatus Microthrix sp.]HMT26434.1 RDD family protein [Microthrixaceae bacterium]HMT61492.1 RDD family protein [Microthrixaceae bacterium]
MNRFCDACGTPMTPHSRFCENCGQAAALPVAQAAVSPIPSTRQGSVVQVLPAAPVGVPPSPVAVVPVQAAMPVAAAAQVGSAGSLRLSTAGKRFGASCLESLLFLVTIGIGWMIWSLIVWGRGQTPSKQLLGMRVVKQDTGQVATWGTMFVREFVAKTLIGYGSLGITSIVGCFMVLNDNHQAFWDRLASTLVVDES